MGDKPPVPMSVLFVGHVNWDIVLHSTTIPDPDGSSPILGDHVSCGGSATNSALTFQSLPDCSAGLLGSIGDDEAGANVEQRLEEIGVESHVVVNGYPTTKIYAVITEGADPRYLARFAELGMFGVSDVPEEAWEEIDHVHVTSFSKEIAEEVAQQASQDGKTVSFNPSQGYKDESFEGVMDVVDVVILNERETEIFRSRYEFDKMKEQAVIITTHGSQGSSAYSNGNEWHHQGYEPPGDIEDAVGAGDSFISGFLSKWGNGANVEDALSYANACGAYAVTVVGAPDELDTTTINDLTEK